MHTFLLILQTVVHSLMLARYGTAEMTAIIIISLYPYPSLASHLQHQEGGYSHHPLVWHHRQTLLPHCWPLRCFLLHLRHCPGRPWCPRTTVGPARWRASGSILGQPLRWMLKSGKRRARGALLPGWVCCRLQTLAARCWWTENFKRQVRLQDTALGELGRGGRSSNQEQCWGVQ